MSPSPSIVSSILIDARQHSRPVYEQLREGLREMILSGQMPAGSRLPSSRQWANDIGVSRVTITRVYDELAGEGFLERIQGSGTYVSSDLSAFATGHRTVEHATARSASAVPLSERASAGSIPLSYMSADAQPVPFRPGTASLEDFPLEIWTKHVQQAWRKSPRALMMDYGETLGYPPLREEIAKHLSITRGARCTPEQIIVTNGSQASLELAVHTLTDPGQQAWIEDPWSAEARGTLSAAGLTTVPVPLDEDGFDLEHALATAPDSIAACVSPSYQFPTGVIMGMRRRLDLLEQSTARGFWIFEHDLDSDFRYEGRPLRVLQGIDRFDRVVHIGSFTRSMYPGVRLGYLVVPTGLVEYFARSRRLSDQVPPMMTQVAMASFMHDGSLARHIRRMRVAYMEKRDALVAALNDVLGEEGSIEPPAAGMHLSVGLPDRLNIDRLVADLRAKSVESLPSRHYSQGEGQNGLILGFAAGSRIQFARAITILQQTLRQALSESASGRPRD